jgi:heptaprenyl diphosphate synthase
MASGFLTAASPYLTVSTLEIANQIMRWAGEYLMAENPMIKRPHGSQHTCPFVKTSLEHDAFHLAIHPEVNGRSEQTIERLMVGTYIEEFDRLPPFQKDQRHKKALLVVFPNIPGQDTKILDVVHRGIKPVFVNAGLMVGQFHQNCDEPAVYNGAYREVSHAPVPLIAVRHMSPHDILFLHEEETLFDLYNREFGARFRDPGQIDSELQPYAKYYYGARDKYRSRRT